MNPDAQSQPKSWSRRLTHLLFILFCLELGLFLLIYPWTSHWSANVLSSFAPEWHLWWENAYVRGAVSGLGLVNLYIAAAEVFRPFRLPKQ